MTILSIEDCVNGRHKIEEYDVEDGLIGTYYFDKPFGGSNELGATEFVDLWQHDPVMARQQYILEQIRLSVERMKQYGTFGIGV